ncbi:MAG: ABC transporter substrate-binding protein [Proteobacteria bacterium]|nr:ABC transporter substrate-binding protein [Pseudomonadota bacterium]
MFRCFVLILATLVSLPVFAAEAVHGIAIHGEPKYKPGFTHFDYVNENAPKGGTLRLSAVGTFDSLNPFIVKGVSASDAGLVFQTLLTGSADETFTQYGLLAESIEVPDDRASATFNIRKEAIWNDGKPVTAADVVWSFETLTKKGAPFYAAYYADVEKVIAENDKRVTFKFKKAGNRELPLTVGQMPVLPKHYWENRKFEETTLEAPLGSGPYKFTKIEPGRSLTFERVKNWWGENLPVSKGRYNFDTVTIDYYRDTTVSVEAFFANRYDVRQEHVAKIWATGYDAPAVKNGQIKKEEIENKLPAGMQAFVMNTRRAVFSDPKVREALQYAFDFEWSNKALAHSAYKRTSSYFENSIYASRGLPEGRELEILKQFEKDLPSEIFTTAFKNPISDGSGQPRDNLRRAMQILDEAGYMIGTDGVRSKNGVRLSFEIVDNQPEFERWVLPFTRNLKRIGIDARFRVVDTTQYVARMNDFDFDMTVSGFGQSLSPGNEQREYWGSDKADTPGSRNLIGIKNPVVDKLCELIATASTQDELTAATKALDRVLLAGHYVIPQWHTNVWKVAYWGQFGRPEKQAPYDLGITDTWWAKKP